MKRFSSFHFSWRDFSINSNQNSGWLGLLVSKVKSTSSYFSQRVLPNIWTFSAQFECVSFSFKQHLIVVHEIHCHWTARSKSVQNDVPVLSTSQVPFPARPFLCVPSPIEAGLAKEGRIGAEKSADSRLWADCCGEVRDKLLVPIRAEKSAASPSLARKSPRSRCGAPIPKRRSPRSRWVQLKCVLRNYQTRSWRVSSYISRVGWSSSGIRQTSEEGDNSILNESKV